MMDLDKFLDRFRLILDGFWMILRGFWMDFWLDFGWNFNGFGWILDG